MKLTVTKGATSQTVYLFIRDSSATTGAGLTGLAYNSGSLVASYVRPLGSRTAITLATQTVTGAWSSGGFVEVDATNMPGVYRLDVPDAVFASGVNSAVVMLKGATNMESSVIEFALEAVNAQDAVRGGMTALPNANAEAAGGLYTRGTGAGQINQPANGMADVNVVRNAGTAITAASGRQEVNVSHFGGSAGTFASGIPAVNATQLSGDSTAADNAEAFFDGTGYAGTNNVIPTVTTLTNAPSDSSGVTTLLSRLSSARAGYLDNLSAGAVALASSLTSAAGDITTLLGKFSGITSLAQWLGLIAGKQTGNSTARTEIRATGAGSGTFDETTDSIEALRDRGDAAWATATGFATAANLSTMQGNVTDILADTADMQPKLGTPVTSISADIAAIEAQTDDIGAAGAGLTAVPWNAAWDAEVQSEVADALTAFGVATASALATVDTVVDAIKVTTDKLDDTLEDDGGTFRFTTNALEQAPSGTGASAASIVAAMFTTDTGETEADAVPGSVVYEIVQNAGGGGSSDWTADEKTAIRSILGIPGSGTTPADPSTGILDTIRDAALAVKAKTDNLPASPASSSDITTAIGSGGASLSAIPWNSAWDSEVQSECADALNAYDPPTNAEMEARTLPSADYATASAVGDVPTAAENATAIWAAGTRTLTAIDEDSTTLDLDATIRSAVGLASANMDTQFGGLPTAAENADAVWDEAASGHVSAGTTGLALVNTDLRGSRTVIRGTAAGSATTTTMTPSALSPSGVDADQFKGRILIFDNDTTTAALRGQATDITANTAASLPVLTFTALTTAPASGDTFSIV